MAQVSRGLSYIDAVRSATQILRSRVLTDELAAEALGAFFLVPLQGKDPGLEHSFSSQLSEWVRDRRRKASSAGLDFKELIRRDINFLRLLRKPVPGARANVELVKYNAYAYESVHFVGINAVLEVPGEARAVGGMMIHPTNDGFGVHAIQGRIGAPMPRIKAETGQHWYEILCDKAIGAIAPFRGEHFDLYFNYPVHPAHVVMRKVRDRYLGEKPIDSHFARISDAKERPRKILEATRKHFRLRH